MVPGGPLDLLADELRPDERVMLIGHGGFVYGISRAEFLEICLLLLLFIVAEFILSTSFDIFKLANLQGAMFLTFLVACLIVFSRRQLMAMPWKFDELLPDFGFLAVTNERLIAFSHSSVQTLAASEQIDRMSFREDSVTVYVYGRQLNITRNDELLEDLGKVLLSNLNPELIVVG